MAHIINIEQPISLQLKVHQCQFAWLDFNDTLLQLVLPVERYLVIPGRQIAHGKAFFPWAEPHQTLFSVRLQIQCLQRGLTRAGQLLEHNIGNLHIIPVRIHHLSGQSALGCPFSTVF